MPNTKTNVMALSFPGKAMYQWPGYGGYWEETAPMHKSQDCSGPSLPLESCTCTTASRNHRAPGGRVGGNGPHQVCWGKQSPLFPSLQSRPPHFPPTPSEHISLNFLFGNFLISSFTFTCAYLSRSWKSRHKFFLLN